MMTFWVVNKGQLPVQFINSLGVLNNSVYSHVVFRGRKVYDLALNDILMKKDSSDTEQLRDSIKVGWQPKNQRSLRFHFAQIVVMHRTFSIWS